MNRKTFNRPQSAATNFHGMVTVSPEMLALFERIKRVARTEASVLIRGDTGSGKALVAHTVHRLSCRAGGPWRTISCAMFPPVLLASELFGHVGGAFMGAARDREGLFSQANGGTLFMGEVSELSLDVQAQLLRVLQERRFVSVGGAEPLDADVRLISATHKVLREEVEKGAFREDLMYRIRVAKLFVPRLVERRGDIEALTWHFIDEFNRQGYRRVDALDGDARDALLAYSWPGNVRELRNAIEGAFAIGDGPVLQVEELPPELGGETLAYAEVPRTGQDLERRRIMDALREAHGRKGTAAALLGVSRSTLWRKLREYGI